MAVKNAMFLFEVVVENVQSFVESRQMAIMSNFADVFSLELRDPKMMHIVMPEAPPLPVDPKAKKGKKAKKPAKPKKGKKGKVEAPPPEPAIQSGQSVLFTSSAEFVAETMRKSPMEVSLWSKEDHIVCIGSCSVPWDPAFYTFLKNIYDCKPATSITVKDEYNIFEEGGAKIVAKLTIQIKLSYLSDRATMAFRTTSEDPAIRKWLFTGMNSKTTSYMCTLKTNDKEVEEKDSSGKKIGAKTIKDLSNVPKPIVFADYKNAPGAKLPLLDDVLCCMGRADKPPDDKYSSPKARPDIDFICEYVRKIISSCNDNLRMLTPRPTIKPKVKATDIDKLCYCRETNWPQSDLANRFKRETQGPPCPICIQKLDGQARPGTKDAQKKIFDIANITGPCGKPDCRIARGMRLYLDNLLDETNKEILLSDIIGPCGSRECTLVDKIIDFLQHKGVFSHGGATNEGLPTECECIKTMQNAIVRKGSCDSLCSHNCEVSETNICGGQICPFTKNKKPLTPSTTAAAKPAAKSPNKPPPKEEIKPKPEDPPKSPPENPPKIPPKSPPENPPKIPPKSPPENPPKIPPKSPPENPPKSQPQSTTPSPTPKK